MTEPRLILGDCVEAMRELDADSIDAVVTDPPYGIGFMGKKWDEPGSFVERTAETSNRFDHVGGNHNPVDSADSARTRRVEGKKFQDWTEAWALEAFRVLKPGGHLLAFGGTRTYHRLAAGIEDAGFEIRDCLAWMFGSGFPKSLDVSKSIDKRRHDVAETYEVTAWIRAARDAAGLSNADIDAAFCANGMGRHWTDVLPGGLQPAVPTLEQIPVLLELLGVTDDEVPERIRHLIFTLNGRKGEPGETWKNARVVGEYDGDPGGFGEHRFGVRDNLIREPSIEAGRWQGWGTALKPAFEPVVMARKPLAGTVAATVLAHGTGALNVDGCRISLDGEQPPRGTGKGTESHARTREGGELAGNGGNNTPDLGRWPANVLLGHSPDCVPAGTRKVASDGHYPAARPGGVEIGTVGHGGQEDLEERSTRGETVEIWDCVSDCPIRLLDAQTRDLSTPGATTSRGRSGVGWGYEASRDVALYGDRGGASRFFYCAKVSRAERNAGLDGFEERVAQDDVRMNGGGGVRHRSGALKQTPNPHTPQRNVHPTVKPLDLMRWLIRLVTPPDGTVLDPFLGSGSTGCAAALEGVGFVGCEREPEYMAIAEARIAFWREHGDDGLRIVRDRDASEKTRQAVEDAGQMSLLG